MSGGHRHGKRHDYDMLTEIIKKYDITLIGSSLEINQNTKLSRDTEIYYKYNDNGMEITGKKTLRQLNEYGSKITNINWLDILKQHVIDEDVKIISISNVPFKDVKNSSRDDKCIFICKNYKTNNKDCKKEGEKTIRTIMEGKSGNVGSGFYCKFCTQINKQDKKGYIKWSPEIIKRFFILSIIFFNTKSKRKKGYWEIPEYDWWRINCSRWCGASIKFNIRFQDLLKTHGASTRRKRNEFSNDKDLIEELKKIYDNEGLIGLTPTSLDEKHTSIYSTYIRQKADRYIIDFENYVSTGWSSGQRVGVHGCPSYWICDNLGILDKRTEYLNKLLKNKTDTELIEIIEGQKNLFEETTQIDRKSYTTEMRLLSKRNSKKYNLNFLRKLLNFKQNGFPTNDGKHTCRSKSEMLFYNRLLKYEGVGVVEYEANIYKNKLWSIDWLIELKNGNKIGVEIWMHNVNISSTHNGRDDYLLRRQAKEQEWQEYKDEYRFFGIEWEDCQKDDIMTNFFENELGLVLNLEYTNSIVISLSDDEQFYKEMREIYNTHGFISTTLMSSSQAHRNSRHYGKTLDGLLEKMVIDKEKNQKLINEHSANEQAKTKKDNCFKNGIEKTKEIMKKLIINDNGITRVNQKLFLQLSGGNNFWQNEAFGSFEKLIDKFNEQYPEYKLENAENGSLWDIKCVDGLYVLYSKVYDDYINYYEKYLQKSNGILTVNHLCVFENYKLGKQTQKVRQHKQNIPKEYLEKLNYLGFIWDERQYKNDILVELIIAIKNKLIEKNEFIKQITQITKTKDIIDNYKYIYYHKSIGSIISSMRQNKQYKEAKKKLLKLHDNNIKILCGI